MTSDSTDLRRFFRNRFEVYADYGNSSAAAELDGSPFTLADVCWHLQNDSEPFPRHYDLDLRRIMARAGTSAIARPRTYGEVAQLIRLQLSEEASPASTSLGYQRWRIA